MRAKRKTLDCVEMKNSIQQKLRREYEARSGEFASYADFISPTADEVESIRAFREKVALAKRADRRVSETRSGASGKARRRK